MLNQIYQNFVLFVGRAQAQQEPPAAGAGGLITNAGITPLNQEPVGLQTIITNIANWVLWIAGAIAVIYLVYGGILYITAGGDETKASKGKTAIVNAVIGIAIILAALIIIRFVRQFIEGNVSGGGTVAL